jgi:hypothetical protein
MSEDMVFLLSGFRVAAAFLPPGGTRPRFNELIGGGAKNFSVIFIFFRATEISLGIDTVRQEAAAGTSPRGRLRLHFFDLSVKSAVK